MKKTIFILAILMIISASAYGELALVLHLDYVVKDQDFIAVYGNGGMLPSVEVKLPTFIKGVQIYGQLGYFSRKGAIVTDEFETSARFTENFLSAGLVWSKYFNRTSIFMKGGPVFVRYQETAFDRTESSTALGFEGGIGATWDIFKNMFILLECDYVYANDFVEDFNVTVKTGGFKGGLGLGFKI